MRILCTSEHHYRTAGEQVWGERLYAYATWQRLLTAFDEVVVLARAAPAPPSGATPPDAALVPVTGPGVRFCALPSRRGLAAAWMPQLPRVMSELLKVPTAMLLRVPGVLPTLLTPWFHRATAIGVMVVGDPAESLLAAGLPGRISAPVIAAHMRWLTQHADALSYVTQHALQRRYPPRAGVPTIAHSDVEIADAALDTAVPATAPGPGLNLVFVAALDRTYKGLDTLLQALAQTRHPHRLTVVGDGVLAPSYRAQAEQLGLGSRVGWRGRLAAGEPVLQEMRLHDAFVLPSRTEGMPRVLLEAMAVGLPALATPVGGVPEVMPPEALVPVDDVAGWARAIDALGEDRPRRSAWARANREAARPFGQTARDARYRAFAEDLRAAAERKRGRGAASPK